MEIFLNILGTASILLLSVAVYIIGYKKQVPQYKWFQIACHICFICYMLFFTHLIFGWI
jgi:hypothetical protein